MEEDEEEDVKEVLQYKLTTTRYQGMLDEEYNSEDLEIMKSNSQRSLYQLTLKKIATKRAIVTVISFLFFLIDSEVSWHNRDNYDSLRLFLNVMRAFNTALTILLIVWAF